MPALLVALVAAPWMCAAAPPSAVVFPRDYAPSEGWVKPPEQPYRAEICLNGRWQFQPVDVPAGWRAGAAPGNAPDSSAESPPDLPPPDPQRWDAVPLKVPSPWNTNALLMEPAGDAGDFRTFPSYPRKWETARMGWLRRTVTVPAAWRGRRLALHFEAVAGECQVLVNGQPVGRHFDPALPFELEVTAAVRYGEPNEILVGIRDAKLFAQRGRYGQLTYPTGSFWLMEAIGIWQDVYLLARPAVYVSDVFVQPRAAAGRLEVDVEVANAGAAPATVSIAAPVHPWLNQIDPRTAGVLDAPEIRWKLGAPVLRLTSEPATIAPGASHVFHLSQPVRDELKPWEVWTRGAPNLYAVLAEVRAGDTTLDCRFERFGWRDLEIRGRELLLNGRPIQLFNEFWHFTGIPAQTRRHVYAWYAMAQAAHINHIRPHAMPHPRFFYDLADEMGMLVLDETGIFGSHVNFNYDAPAFWSRCRQHVRDLVRRDRNHPSIMGWSVANEIWCAMQTKAAPPAYQEALWDRVADLANLARETDPTRQWVQSDGDRDLGGRLPVYPIHWGNGPFRWDYAALPAKPWGVTEGGSSYYGVPSQYAAWVGDRAYRSFGDRMDALAIEAYGILKEVRAHGGVCNVTNLSWHGLKPLPLGLRDRGKRQLELTDGVCFPPFVEGKPGVQPERLGPYCVTLNPGYDAGLPLYDPWPLYLAAQAALDPRGAQPGRWEAAERGAALGAGAGAATKPAVVEGKPSVTAVGFIGSRNGGAYAALRAAGAPLGDDAPDLRCLAIDASTLAEADRARAAAAVQRVTQAGGMVFVLGLTPASAATAQALLPRPVTVFAREAVSLLPAADEPRLAAITLADLYFAESGRTALAAPAALGGELAERGRVLLRANPTDWRRWIDRAEYIRTVAIVRSELENRADPVLVETPAGAGRILVSTLATERLGQGHVRLYRKLLAGLGVALGDEAQLAPPALDSSGVLVNALALGRFGAESAEAALARDFIGEATAQPREGAAAAERTWKPVSNTGDRFLAGQLRQPGPSQGFAVYLSFRVFSPHGRDDLLAGGPDLPRVQLRCYVSRQAKVLLNGQELTALRTEPADYRTLLTFARLPLRQGWNHILLKLAGDTLEGPEPATLAARLECSDPAYQAQLLSAVAAPREGTQP